jgi:hypothetical protein
VDTEFPEQNTVITVKNQLYTATDDGYYLCSSAKLFRIQISSERRTSRKRPCYKCWNVLIYKPTCMYI